MKLQPLIAAGLLASWSVQADFIKVPFSATIFETPFTASGFTAGSQITGAFYYEPNASAVDSGVNFNAYRTPRIELLLASTEIVTPGKITVADHLNRVGRGPYDGYEVDIFSLGGSPVEGYVASHGVLTMQDDDLTAYTPPFFPIDFPDPALFEEKLLILSFALPNAGRLDPPVRIQATVDQIGPANQIAAVPDQGSLSWALIGTVICLIARGSLSQHQR